jgi:hypothetical protein
MRAQKCPCHVGPPAGVYAFYKGTIQRNLYRNPDFLILVLLLSMAMSRKLRS